MLKTSEIKRLVADGPTKTSQGRAAFLANREKRVGTKSQRQFLADYQAMPTDNPAAPLPASTLPAMTDAVIAENPQIEPHEAIARAGQALESAAGATPAMLAAGAKLATDNLSATQKTSYGSAR